VGDYRKLIVWQKSVTLTEGIQSLVDRIPAKQRKRIGDQLVRAADSIRANIVEGCGLNSDRQLARHLLIALGSANEVQDDLALLESAGALTDADRKLAPDVAQIRAMIVGLHRRLSPPKEDS
jgi:four helix bundle protein